MHAALGRLLAGLRASPSAPLKLPAGHFGLGFGDRAHAPDEYCVIKSTNPKLHGMDDMVRSQVDILFELGA